MEGAAGNGPNHGPPGYTPGAKGVLPLISYLHLIDGPFERGLGLTLPGLGFFHSGLGLTELPVAK